MGLELSVATLLDEYDTKIKKDPTLDPACILFPYTRTLRDDDVQDFYAALRSERKYNGHTFATVEEIKHFADTYKIINRCVVEGFIRV